MPMSKKKNEKKVKDLGGLFIIGTERHESRRIDNQLRGDQEDKEIQVNNFFISLQDELMRIFGGDSIDGMLKKLGLKENDQSIIPGLIKLWKEPKKKLRQETLIFEKL